MFEFQSEFETWSLWLNLSKVSLVSRLAANSSPTGQPNASSGGGRSMKTVIDW